MCHRNMTRSATVFVLLLFPATAFAGCLFEKYKGRPVDLRTGDILGSPVGNSLTRCEEYCLESDKNCQGVDVIPVRSGVYSCVLLKTVPALSTVGFFEINGGVYLHRQGK